MGVAATLLAVVMIVAGAVPAGAKTTLRLTIQLPMSSTLGKNILKFKTEVEKATNGNLEIQIFDSGQLFSDKEVPVAVATGQIDMGVVSIARYAGTVPAVDVFSVPFLFDTDEKLRAAVASGSTVRGPIDEAIAITGARVLWWQAYGGAVLLSRSGNAVRSPADVKGKRVHVTGRLARIWVIGNGGSPVEVSGGEQYSAYQRGVVEIGMTNADTIRSRKLWEVMDTVTVTNLGVIEFVVVINEKMFQALSDAERTIIADAAAKAELKLRKDLMLIEREAIEAGRQHKMTIVVPTVSEMQAFRDSAETVRVEFLKNSGELGRRVHDAALDLK